MLLTVGRHGMRTEELQNKHFQASDNGFSDARLRIKIVLSFMERVVA